MADSDVLVTAFEEAPDHLTCGMRPPASSPPPSMTWAAEESSASIQLPVAHRTTITRRTDTGGRGSWPRPYRRILCVCLLTGPSAEGAHTKQFGARSRLARTYGAWGRARGRAVRRVRM